jgi:assimilatory nitrate reductase catalytic subunit
VPHLMTHVAAPQLAIHPRDAEEHGLVANALARIESEQGSSVMRVEVTDQQRLGEVFAPMHWSDQFSSTGAIDRLVGDRTDPVSGQPDLKGSSVRVSAVEELWTGLLLRRTGATPDLGANVYWTKAPIESGFAFDLAGWTDLTSIIRSEMALRRLLQIPNEAELLSYSDPKKSVYRYAGFIGDRLESCLFLSPAGTALPSRDVAMRFLSRAIEPMERLALLAAHVPDPTAVPEKIVCACFSVGCNTIAAAIHEKNLKNVGEIGADLKAGTNCGSCIPELKKMLQDAAGQRKTLSMAH